MRGCALLWCSLGFATLWSAVACTSAQAHFFLLEEDLTEPGDGSTRRTVVLVQPVTIPAEVDRPQIVIREAHNQITIYEQQRWAAPLKETLPASNHPRNSAASARVPASPPPWLQRRWAQRRTLPSMWLDSTYRPKAARRLFCAGYTGNQVANRFCWTASPSAEPKSTRVVFQASLMRYAARLHKQQRTWRSIYRTPVSSLESC